MTAVNLAASMFSMSGLHEGSYMLVLLPMSINEACCMCQKRTGAYSSRTLDVTVKSSGCSIENVNCIAEVADKQRLQSSACTLHAPIMGASVECSTICHTMIAGRPAVGMDACAAGCSAANWTSINCYERHETGHQLERVLSAEVLQACTGMEPTGANSLWRSA